MIWMGIKSSIFFCPLFFRLFLLNWWTGIRVMKTAVSQTWSIGGQVSLHPDNIYMKKQWEPAISFFVTILERQISWYFFISGSGKLWFLNFSELGNPGSEPLLLKISFKMALSRNSYENVSQNTPHNCFKLANLWQTSSKLQICNFQKKKSKPKMLRMR